MRSRPLVSRFLGYNGCFPANTREQSTLFVVHKLPLDALHVQRARGGARICLGLGWPASCAVCAGAPSSLSPRLGLENGCRPAAFHIRFQHTFGHPPRRAPKLPVFPQGRPPRSQQQPAMRHSCLLLLGLLVCGAAADSLGDVWRKNVDLTVQSGAPQPLVPSSQPRSCLCSAFEADREPCAAQPGSQGPPATLRKAQPDRSAASGSAPPTPPRIPCPLPRSGRHPVEDWRGGAAALPRGSRWLRQGG